MILNIAIKRGIARVNKVQLGRFSLAILGVFSTGLIGVVYAFSSLSGVSFAVGFFSSLLIVLATFYSHYHHVLEASKREECVILEEMRARRQEDPYELFEEEELQELPMTDTTTTNAMPAPEIAPITNMPSTTTGTTTPDIAPSEEITRETLKRWKPKGRLSLEGLRHGARLSLSLYRLLAYLLLIGGVLYLIRHEILHVYALFIGVFFSTVGILCIFLFIYKD